MRFGVCSSETYADYTMVILASRAHTTQIPQAKNIFGAKHDKPKREEVMFSLAFETLFCFGGAGVGNA